jgi:tetratricopeptide (TPR) repeat protein
VISGLGLALLTGAAARASVQVAALSGAQPSLRTTAWDRSIADEKRGRLSEARRALVDAWGEQPDGYEVSLRVAWLTLQLGDALRATVLYERARHLEGAGPDATQGLIAALLAAGDQSIADKDFEGARAAWRRALELEPNNEPARRGLATIPENYLIPELWIAYLAQSTGSFESFGGVVFAHVPLALGRWRFRVAYRHERLWVREGSPLRFPGDPLRYVQHDAYAGAGYTAGPFSADVLGLAVLPSSERTVFGESATLRAGRRYGCWLDQALLQRERGTSLQLAPRAFVWPWARFAVSAGARLTWDDQGRAASALASATYATPGLWFDLSGSAGLERWPVVPSVPEVLTYGEDIVYSGRLTALVSLSSEWAVAGQAELAVLDIEGFRGGALSAALGLSWSPSLDAEGEQP